MRFCNEKEPLYLETDTSGAGHGAGQVQAINGMKCLKGKAQDNVIPRHTYHSQARANPVLSYTFQRNFTTIVLPDRYTYS